MVGPFKSTTGQIESNYGRNDGKMRDFTLKMYGHFCESVSNSGYRTVAVGDYFASSDVPKRLFLRHDVDRNPNQALDMAHLENELGLISTYFFRVVPCVYNEKIIKSITDLGMEIGYHYEVLDKARGDMGSAIEIFEKELAQLRRSYPVRSISMHGNPLTKYDNRDIWKQYEFEDYGIEVSAYLSMDFRNVRYLSDTGRTFHPEIGNLQDFASRTLNLDLRGTRSLIEYLRDNPMDTCLLIHPNRWSDNPFVWCYNYCYDMLGNMAKGILKKARVRT